MTVRDTSFGPAAVMAPELVLDNVCKSWGGAATSP
jgi:hypothetical protein